MEGSVSATNEWRGGKKVRQAVAAIARIGVKFGVTATLLLSVPSAGAIDLLEVYRLAVANDPEYLSAGSANRAAQEQTPQARSRLLPGLSLSANSDFNHEKTRQAGAFGGAGTTRYNGNSFRLSLTQPIYRKDLLIGLNQADTRVRQSNAEFAFALQELMLRAAERYFDALRAVDNLEFLRSERDANERQLEQSRQRFEVGLIAVTDVEEAKAGFDLAYAQVIEAEIAVDNAWEALRELTGVYLDLVTLKPLSKDTPLTPTRAEQCRRMDRDRVGAKSAAARRVAGGPDRPNRNTPSGSATPTHPRPGRIPRHDAVRWSFRGYRHRHLEHRRAAQPAHLSGRRGSVSHPRVSSSASTVAG